MDQWAHITTCRTHYVDEIKLFRSEEAFESRFLELEYGAVGQVSSCMSVQGISEAMHLSDEVMPLGEWHRRQDRKGDSTQPDHLPA